MDELMNVTTETMDTTVNTVAEVATEVAPSFLPIHHNARGRIALRNRRDQRFFWRSLPHGIGDPRSVARLHARFKCPNRDCYISSEGDSARIDRAFAARLGTVERVPDRCA